MTTHLSLHNGTHLTLAMPPVADLTLDARCDCAEAIGCITSIIEDLTRKPFLGEYEIPASVTVDVTDAYGWPAHERVILQKPDGWEHRIVFSLAAAETVDGRKFRTYEVDDA